MKSFLPALTVLALALGACNGDTASGVPTTSASTLPADQSAPTEPAMSAGSTNAAAPPSDPVADTQANAAAGTWSYDSAKDGDGTETRASIAGTADGAPATLVFSDHDVWGRNVFLQPSQGDVECPVGCKVQVSIDGAAALAVQASRPESSPPRLSLRTPEMLWKSIAAARTLIIEYPRADGTAKAEFQVAGADPAKLPGWN